MALDKNVVVFGDFSDDEIDQLYDNSTEAPVQFSPPASASLLSGKSFTGNYSNSSHSDSGDNSPVFSFPLASDDHDPEIQFGSTIKTTPLIANDNGLKFNVNANEFVPSNRSVIKRGGETIPHPSNQATSIQPSSLSHPPFPAAMYYQYYPQWVADPRCVPPAFFQHFGHHGYQYPYPGPPPHPLSVPQVAVVAPYRTTGDIRPALRILEEKLRGNKCSILDTPKYQASPISPNSLPSPPSTHGDSGIDLGQSKSVSPPLTLVQPLPVRPSSVNEVHVPVGNETPPNNEDTAIDVTTPTQIESESNRTNEVTSLLSNSIPVDDDNVTESVPNVDKEQETTPTYDVGVSNEHIEKLSTSSQDHIKDTIQTTPTKIAPTNIELKQPNISNSKPILPIKTTPTGNENSSNISISNNNNNDTKTTPTGNKEDVVPPNTVTPTTDTPTVAPPTTSTKKSWASIVGTSNNNHIAKNKSEEITTPTEQERAAVKEVSTEKAVTSSVDPLTEGAKTRLKLLGGQLKLCSVIQDSPVSVVPRGLRNNGNLCYIHAPLQALINCPSFYHLFTSIKLPSSRSADDHSLTDVTDTMIQFVRHFRVYPRDQHEDGKVSHKKKKSTLLYEDPFRPDFIYEMLTKAKSRLSVMGRQEDAEEFLCWLLSKLHDEMVSAIQAIDPTHTNETTNEQEEEEEVGQCDDEGEWQEVGPRNKSTITRRTSCEESPISKMFGGKLQSTIHRHGMKETVTVEPFFSLQLDIQSNDVRSIKDALEMLCVKESVSLSGADKEAITGATRRLTIAELPHCLILHIKRFYYDGTATHKVHKAIDYDQNLEIPKDLIAVTTRGKITQAQRTYKLWAVICHQGKTVDKGHYICDVYHSATSSWIRVNDNYVKMVPADFVFNPSGAPHQHVPYLLFYKQCDNMSRRM